MYIYPHTENFIQAFEVKVDTNMKLHINVDKCISRTLYLLTLLQGRCSLRTVAVCNIGEPLVCTTMIRTVKHQALRFSPRRAVARSAAAVVSFLRVVEL